MKNKANILLAEDDKEIANTLAENLSGAGYDVTLACDGEEALNFLLEKKFELVILDLQMPKVGGFGVLKYIKQAQLSPKIIILTAYADIKNVQECKKLGADHVIAKPYDLELLFWTIDMVMMKGSNSG